MTNAPQDQYPSHRTWTAEDYLMHHGLISAEELSHEDRRNFVTSAIGNEIGTIFDRHADFATEDADGTKRVSLLVQLSTSRVPAHITSKIDESNNREAFMWLQSGKALGTEMYRYTDGPDKPALLEPYKFDKETGRPVPKQASENYDPAKDDEVAFWGKVWVNNLRNCPPVAAGSHEKSERKNSRLRKTLGRMGILRG